VVDEQGAIDEFATIKPRENDLASKIELLTLKAFVPDDALFRWSIGTHLSPLVFGETRIR
jgi:hypothetical protein